MATTKTAGEYIREFLSASYATIEGRYIPPHHISRFWVEDTGHTSNAYIEYRASETGGGLYISRWQLSPDEMIRYRRILRETEPRYDRDGIYIESVTPLGMDRSIMGMPTPPDISHPIDPDAAQSISSPVTFPGSGPRPRPRPRPIWNLPEHAISVIELPRTPSDPTQFGFRCKCTLKFHCEEVRTWLGQQNANDAILGKIPTVTHLNQEIPGFAVPLFGLVLHRLHARTVPAVDWDETAYMELRVACLTFRPERIERLYHSRDYASGLVNPFVEIMEFIENDFATDALAREHVQVADDFGMNRGGNYGCVARTHNYGTTSELRNFLAPGGAHRDKALSAQAFTSLCYNKCYICYRASELAFSAIDLT